MIKTKTGVILLSIAVLAILIMPIFAQANSSGMSQGQATSSNASLKMGTTSANAGSNSIVVNIMAKNRTFNTSTITVPASAQVTINFDNQDSGVRHDVAFYTDSSASNTVHRTLAITGPNKITDTFIAPSAPGNYFFRCDFHPNNMTGQFIVTPSTGSNTSSNTVNTSSSI